MPNSAEELAVSSIGLEAFLAAVALLGAAFSRRSLVERLGLGPGRLPAAALAWLALGTLGTSLALDGLLELSGWREQSAIAELEAQIANARGRALLLVLLGIGVAPGLAEELLCRGLVQRGLEPRLGAPAAIGCAALVFGLLHAEPLHAAAAGLLGVYLGVVAQLAGSVRAAMLCHVVNNTAAVLGAVLGAGRWVSPGLALPLGGALAAAGLLAALRPRLQPGPRSVDP